MNPKRSLFDQSRRVVWSLKDTFIDQLCTLGLISDPQTIHISGISANFRVSTANERWRVKNGMGEEDVLKLVIRTIDEGDCFWDIGAAVGTYSCLALVAGADVVAFEPHSGNRNRCEENIRLNGYQPDVREIALSDSNSILKLEEEQGTGAGMHRISSEGKLEVKTIRGDEIDAPEPDVIKIDVEGHELKVLRGMEARLKSVRRAFIECHPKFGVNTEEVETFLQSSGFKTNLINTGRADATFIEAYR